MGKTSRNLPMPNAATPVGYHDLAHYRALAERHRSEAVAWAVAGVSHAIGRLITGKTRRQPL